MTTANTTYTFKNVAPGQHTFSIELVNDDNTPLSPPVMAKVVIVLSTAAGTGP